LVVNEKEKTKAHGRTHIKLLKETIGNINAKKRNTSEEG
jgi:hypothetical protein